VGQIGRGQREGRLAEGHGDVADKRIGASAHAGVSARIGGGVASRGGIIRMRSGIAVGAGAAIHNDVCPRRRGLGALACRKKQD
jgi:hypothetical protein